MKYKEAKTELDLIVSDIESGNVELDLLSEKIKRAGKLIEICKNKLRETEVEVNNLIKDIEDNILETEK